MSGRRQPIALTARTLRVLVAARERRENPWMLTRTDRQTMRPAPCGCFTKPCPKPVDVGRYGSHEPYLTCPHSCPDDVHGSQHYILAPPKKIVTEIPATRLDPFAMRSFLSGSRGFWLMSRRRGRELWLEGPWLNGSNRPLVKVIAFRDSEGWIAKFIEGPPESAAAFQAAYTKRCVDPEEEAPHART